MQWPAWIREISREGVTLLAERKFTRGTRLTIQVAQQVEDAPLVLEVEVVHVLTLTQGKWAMGCLLQTPLTEQELEAFLHKYSEIPINGVA